MGLRVVWQLELLEQLSRVRPGGNTPTVNDHNRLLELSVRLALKKQEYTVRYGKSGVRHMGEMGAVGEKNEYLL